MNTGTQSVADLLDAQARKAADGPWVPASGGTERPFFTRSKRHLLYCWQPGTGRHAYLDLGTDMILTDEEAGFALGQ